MTIFKEQHVFTINIPQYEKQLPGVKFTIVSSHEGIVDLLPKIKDLLQVCEELSLNLTIHGDTAHFWVNKDHHLLIRMVEASGNILVDLSEKVFSTEPRTDIETKYYQITVDEAIQILREIQTNP